MTGNCPKKTNPDAVKIPVIRVRNKTFLNDRKASVAEIPENKIPQANMQSFIPPMFMKK